MTLYDELAAYTGRPLELVRLRGQYAGYELAWHWPNAKSTIDFYSETDLYLYDLTEYQTRLHAAGWHEWLISIIKKYNIQSVLDFGGGIGESTLTCYHAGVDKIDFLEILKSPQAQYAMSRFVRREATSKISFLNHVGSVVDDTYDLVIAMDVLEHLKEPETLLKRFQRMAPFLICNADDLPYGVLNPQHISHPDVQEFYTKANGNFWMRKEGL